MGQRKNPDNERPVRPFRVVDAAFAAGQSTSARLTEVLNQHCAWVGSGWELGARADLHALDLHLANFAGAMLSDADLHDADLHGAHLERADLDGCDLHSANLYGAHLEAASLPYADLHGADLRRADLQAADLTDADLGDTDLRGADLRHARGLRPEQLGTARIDEATLLSDEPSSACRLSVGS